MPCRWFCVMVTARERLEPSVLLQKASLGSRFAAPCSTGRRASAGNDLERDATVGQVGEDAVQTSWERQAGHPRETVI